MSICQRTVNCKNIWNVPWDALMCPLQITNDIEHLSSTLHGVNETFIRHPSNVENYSHGHKSDMGQPNQKKKKASRIIYFYTSLANFWLKIQNTDRYKRFWIFSTPAQSALNGPPNGPTSIWSKIQNRLSRAP